MLESIAEKGHDQPRIAGNRLLDQTFVDYFLAIHKVLKNDGRLKTTTLPDVSGAGGADFLVPLLTLNSTRLIVIDTVNVNSQRLQRLTKQPDLILDAEKTRVDKALGEFRRSAFFNAARTNETEISPLITAFINGLGSNISSISSQEPLTFQFAWQHPEDKLPKLRTVEYYHDTDLNDFFQNRIDKLGKDFQFRCYFEKACLLDPSSSLASLLKSKMIAAESFALLSPRYAPDGQHRTGLEANQVLVKQDWPQEVQEQFALCRQKQKVREAYGLELQLFLKS